MDVIDDRLAKYIKYILVVFIGVFPIIFGSRTVSGALHFSFHKYIVLIVTICLLWVLFLVRYIIYKKQIARITIPEIILIIFTGLLVISTLFSVDIYLSLYGTRTRYEGLSAWFSYLSLFYFTYHFLDRRDYPILSKIILLGALVSAIYAIVEHYFPNMIGYQSTRSEAFYDNPNFFGSYLVLMILFTSTLLNVVMKRHQIILLYILNCLLFTAMIISMTRSAWIGTGIGLIMMTVIIVRKRRELWKRWLLVAVSFFIIFIAIQFSSELDYVSRASSIVKEGTEFISASTTGEEVKESGGAGRVLIWKLAFPLVKDYFWIGSGPDTLMQVFPQEEWHAYQPNNYVDKAHNEYLHMAITMGVPTLIVYLIFIGSIILIAIRTAKHRPEKEKVLCYGLVTLVIGYLVQAFFNISVIPVAPFFWVFLAFLFKVAKETKTFSLEEIKNSVA